MAERATTADDRYGVICECGMPKTKQALRCRPCFIESRQRPRIQLPRETCPDCGGPMWTGSKLCRACWKDHGVNNPPAPPDHIFRIRERQRRRLSGARRSRQAA